MTISIKSTTEPSTCTACSTNNSPATIYSNIRSKFKIFTITIIISFIDFLLQILQLCQIANFIWFSLCTIATSKPCCSLSCNLCSILFNLINLTTYEGCVAKSEFICFAISHYSLELNVLNCTWVHSDVDILCLTSCYIY